MAGRRKEKMKNSRDSTWQSTVYKVKKNSITTVKQLMWQTSGQSKTVLNLTLNLNRDSCYKGLRTVNLLAGHV